MSKNTKILVVDDEPVGRQLLEAILISEGFEIIFAENGRKAYDIAVNESPDVILCDVMMPLMDGYEVCRKIRKNSDIAHTPVFLITALDDRDSRIKGIDAGADDYISKPFDRLEILAKVKNAATLLSVRKKTETEKTSEKSNKNGTGLNDSLFKALISSMFETQLNSNIVKQDLYRSHPLMESSHAIWNMKTETGDYICLLSNNLLANEAVLINGIINRLINNNTLANPNSPAKITQNTLNQFKNLSAQYKLTGTEELHISLIILLASAGEAIISGINNVVYVSGGTDSSNSPSGNNIYQPYYLMGNQDIIINNPKNICLFSGNIQLLLLQPELIAFLNTNFVDSTQSDNKEILESKFGISTDMIFTKIGF